MNTSPFFVFSLPLTVLCVVLFLVFRIVSSLSVEKARKQATKKISKWMLRTVLGLALLNLIAGMAMAILF